MKRSWIGFGLLIVLLAAGLFSTWGMGKIHENIESDLKQAAECAILGDWVNAGGFFQKAQGEWKRWERFRASLADHNPVEEIDAGFAALEVYGYAQEDVAFAAQCCSLARQVAAVGEAHELVWWNLM